METTSLHTVALLIDIAAAAILVTAFLIVSTRNLVFYIRLFALQSFLLAGVAFLVAIGYGETHIFFAAFLTVAIKAIAIPLLMTKIIDRIHVQKEIDFSVNITVSLLLCGGLVILAGSVARSILSIQEADASGISRILSASIAMMLIGLFIMMTRRKAVTQIIGLLTMENGVFLSGLSITYGMPLIVEVGIFFDILIAVLILGVFVFRINKTFDSISIDSLRSLRH
ncbi:MAG TPA: NADH-quinone oxidoreductase subunit K [Bacteroidota bacterium]|nr:NADH-quinone oxidoreductase subunit K [Bacteroidota bacterium]